MAATDTHATTEELLEAVFSVRPVPILHNEEKLRLRTSLEAIISCETVAGQQGCEHGS
jgi:hypothetical protein